MNTTDIQKPDKSNIKAAGIKSTENQNRAVGKLQFKGNKQKL